MTQTYLQVPTQATLLLQKKRLGGYEQFGCGKDIAAVKRLASLLRDIKSTHTNSTCYEGGGVAENLSSLISLAEGLSLHMSWQVLQAPRDFFEVTKAIHNILQDRMLDFERQMAEKTAYLLMDPNEAKRLDVC